MHHKRYAVYWDLLNEQQWIEREANYKKELERVRKLEALTVDFVQPGEDAARTRAQPARRTHGRPANIRVASGDTRETVAGCRSI